MNVEQQALDRGIAYALGERAERERIKVELDLELERWKANKEGCRYAAGRLAAAKHFASRWGFYDFGKLKDHSHA